MKPNINKSVSYNAHEKLNSKSSNKVILSNTKDSPLKSCIKKYSNKDLLKKNSLTNDEDISTGTNTNREFGVLDKKIITDLRNQAIIVNKNNKNLF